MQTKNSMISSSQGTDVSEAGVSDVKRFTEMWIADQSFRKDLHVDARRATLERGLIVDPEDIRLIWDENFRDAFDEAEDQGAFLSKQSPVLQSFAAYIETKKDHVFSMKAKSAPADSRFRAWRERQIARLEPLYSLEQRHATPHVNFAIELSKGCSVGCWFCGVSAPRLSDHFYYTADHARLWRGVLRSLRAVCGTEGGGHGFLYWASDPFDNPDYEKFCFDFEAEFGRFPVTTTAKVLEDRERSRRLIERSKERVFPKVRFSILTMKILRAVFEEFSPEELLHVDITPQNKGTYIRQRAAGRARARYKRQAERTGRSLIEVTDQSIACVSGFLLNMQERSLKLITPCSASDRWPLGYYIYDETRFKDARDFEAALETMIEKHMGRGIARDRAVRFAPGLQLEPASVGFRLTAAYGSKTFSENPFFAELGELLDAGSHRVDEILQYFQKAYSIDPGVSAQWLDGLFQHGVLDDEPLVRESLDHA